MILEGEVESASHSPLIRQLCRYLSERSPQPMVAVEGTTHIAIYVNPAFARLVGKRAEELVGRPFAEGVPEGKDNGCLGLLDRVFRSGIHEVLLEQEHRQAKPQPVYWTYSVWAILGPDERPAGVMIQITDATETALFRRRAAAMNEALLVAGLKQHELMEASESLKSQLNESHDRLEGRVAERTVELAEANALLRAEIGTREAAEGDRRDLLRRLGTAQEDERRRISRELHDQMGQHLTALSLGLKVAKDETPNPSPARDRLQSLQSLTGVIGREIHDLALELRPTALDDLGLRAALANYAEVWSERSGVEVDYHTTGLDGGRLPPQVETALYRVVQESLTNVIKHARARRVSVVLLRSADYASAVVEDDGCGFDPDSGPNTILGNRLGLLGMQERTTLLGGSLTVESVPGRGTTVIARVPFDAEGDTGLNG